jgi:hypothetical protein
MITLHPDAESDMIAKRAFDPLISDPNRILGTHNGWQNQAQK